LVEREEWSCADRTADFQGAFQAVIGPCVESAPKAPPSLVVACATRSVAEGVGVPMTRRLCRIQTPSLAEPSTAVRPASRVELGASARSLRPPGHDEGFTRDPMTNVPRPQRASIPNLHVPEAGQTGQVG
jgi:hypothetical protein